MLISIYGIIQNPQWINYTNGDNINAVVQSGDSLLVGTEGGFVKLHKTSMGKVVFTHVSGLPKNNTEVENFH